MNGNEQHIQKYVSIVLFSLLISAGETHRTTEQTNGDRFESS